jgi:Bacterial aa3 type cytochrome c oxidase subunit IV
MAGHGDTNGETNAMDITAHRASYQGFMSWFKWGAIVAFIVAAVAVVIIS